MRPPAASLPAALAVIQRRHSMRQCLCTRPCTYACAAVRPATLGDCNRRVFAEVHASTRSDATSRGRNGQQQRVRRAVVAVAVAVNFQVGRAHAALVIDRQNKRKQPRCHADLASTTGGRHGAANVYRACGCHPLLAMIRWRRMHLPQHRQCNPARVIGALTWCTQRRCAVIFLDEMDALFSKRGGGGGGGGDASQARIVTQLLTLMDGFGDGGDCDAGERCWSGRALVGGAAQQWHTYSLVMRWHVRTWPERAHTSTFAARRVRASGGTHIQGA
jgi:ATPase family associated with various cellular activities (AAA)